MKKSRYLRIYDLHSWSGIILGLFVYVVSFTGCLALFENELKGWEDPAKRLVIAQQSPAMMPKLQAWIDQNSKNEEVELINFTYPHPNTPYFQVLMNTRSEGGERTRHETRWDTQHGKELVFKNEALTEWLLDFHRDLMWPAQLGGRTVGRAIVGVAGVILMLSIITGIITHTKIIREFFTLRVKRSVHLKWQDLHKILGLWALPFYTMISFTGAFLGIIAILAPLAAVLAFKGDTEALFIAVNGVDVERSGVQAKMLSVDELKELRHPQSNTLPERIIVNKWGDQTATYAVRFPSQDTLTRRDVITLDGVTGELKKSKRSSSERAADRANSLITPLHYATYGGIWLKALYVVLGLFLCIVTATGLMVWIERRLKNNKGASSQQFYLRLGRFSNGVIMGFPIASIAIFYLDKLYIGAESSRLFYTGICYFAAVFLTILFAMLRTQDYRTTRILFSLCSIGLLGLPIVNAIMTNSDLFYGLANNQTWAWADVSFFASGLILLVISFYLPKERSVEPSDKKNAALAASGFVQ